MTVVIGTAGHIDHGKTSLLRALTGIDADRLPEERRRGMTIDVGYAHLRLDDGSALDFVDVPGHDRLIGNMLVGAGEIDAAMLVVAADDGPRAQTLEHLELLDALGIDEGLAAVTKTDVVEPARVVEVVNLVRALLSATSLRDRAVVAVSSATGEGLDDVRQGLGDVARRLARRGLHRGPARMAIDRAFSVRGRGMVVTGSLRGRPVSRGDVLRVAPDGGEVRVRDMQVHNAAVERVDGGGRVALNVAGPAADRLHRGLVLTAGAGVERSDRLLLAVLPAPGRRADLRHGLRIRLHLGTDQIDGRLDLGRRATAEASDGRLTAIAALDRPVAAAFGDPLVIRRPSPGETLAGARVLDPQPPRGASRRRIDAATLRRLLDAEPGTDRQLDALVALHGVLAPDRAAAWRAASTDAATAESPAGSERLVAPDVVEVLGKTAQDAVAAQDGLAASTLRTVMRVESRRHLSITERDADALGEAIVAGLVAGGDLVRDGERLLPRGAQQGRSTAVAEAMDRLVTALAVPAPPGLSEAAASAGCPPDAIRVLESDGRIVRVEDDLAWERQTYRGLEDLAIGMASATPLTPAAYRDATRTSRRYALAILEDLDRRNVLRRTPAGHVPGPRAVVGSGR